MNLLAKLKPLLKCLSVRYLDVDYSQIIFTSNWTFEFHSLFHAISYVYLVLYFFCVSVCISLSVHAVIWGCVLQAKGATFQLNRITMQEINIFSVEVELI